MMSCRVSNRPLSGLGDFPASPTAATSATATAAADWLYAAQLFLGVVGLPVSLEPDASGQICTHRLAVCTAAVLHNKREGHHALQLRQRSWLAGIYAGEVTS